MRSATLGVTDIEMPLTAERVWKAIYAQAAPPYNLGWKGQQ